MLAGIKGKIEEIGSDWVVIDTGSLSFKVYVTTSTLSEMGSAGSSVKLHTHLHVKEDGLTLYGFSSARELSLFELITSVSGIGPRLGLAMLSAMNVDRLSSAIVNSDKAVLSSIPGIGKKTAERIILELKDKIGSKWVIEQAVSGKDSGGDVIAALTLSLIHI